MKPIIEAQSDLSGGILLTTGDQWTIEDLSESIVKTVGISELLNLQAALIALDVRDLESIARLDNARYEVAQCAKGRDRLIIARLLPEEASAILAEIKNAMLSKVASL